MLHQDVTQKYEVMDKHKANKKLLAFQPTANPRNTTDAQKQPKAAGI